ncbi:hypothetical protein SELMODRAFT_402950 [Selaginella moellendorffii]|uniref:Uncharacterized protein n=1 Tax=Selaginella moellendorffii TaxID=88036 RepID=D8QNJ8_SELML|nr:hypothetical protein SELMODRAFT_402950 [Selaginella moellendorffii]
MELLRCYGGDPLGPRSSRTGCPRCELEKEMEDRLQGVNEQSSKSKVEEVIWGFYETLRVMILCDLRSVGVLEEVPVARFETSNHPDGWTTQRWQGDMADDKQN